MFCGKIQLETAIYKIIERTLKIIFENHSLTAFLDKSFFHIGATKRTSLENKNIQNLDFMTAKKIKDKAYCKLTKDTMKT